MPWPQPRGLALREPGIILPVGVAMLVASPLLENGNERQSLVCGKSTMAVNLDKPHLWKEDTRRGPRRHLHFIANYRRIIAILYQHSLLFFGKVE